MPRTGRNPGFAGKYVSCVRSKTDKCPRKPDTCPRNRVSVPGTLGRTWTVREFSLRMYNDFYRFRESPFNITPDPRFLFFSERHREAFNHILFGLRELGSAYRTALILNPCMTSTQLLRTVLSEYGLKPRRVDRVSCLDALNEF